LIGAVTKSWKESFTNKARRYASDYLDSKLKEQVYESFDRKLKNAIDIEAISDNMIEELIINK